MGWQQSVSTVPDILGSGVSYLTRFRALIISTSSWEVWHLPVCNNVVSKRMYRCHSVTTHQGCDNNLNGYFFRQAQIFSSISISELELLRYETSERTHQVKLAIYFLKLTDKRKQHQSNVKQKYCGSTAGGKKLLSPPLPAWFFSDSTWQNFTGRSSLRCWSQRACARLDREPNELITLAHTKRLHQIFILVNLSCTG